MELDALEYVEFRVDLASNFISTAAEDCVTSDCGEPYFPFDLSTASARTQKTQNKDVLMVSEAQAKTCIRSSVSSTPACVASQTIEVVTSTDGDYYSDYGMLGLGPTTDAEKEFSFVQGLA